MSEEQAKVAGGNLIQGQGNPASFVEKFADGAKVAAIGGDLQRATERLLLSSASQPESGSRKRLSKLQLQILWFARCGGRQRNESSGIAMERFRRRESGREAGGK